MNLKQLIKFGLENSSDPVIKNPILRQALEPRSMDQAALSDDLEPGSLKDELAGNFDPSQETYEEYLQRINLERPFNMAEGGQLVAPSVDGSRPGYKGTPGNITTKFPTASDFRIAESKIVGGGDRGFKYVKEYLDFVENSFNKGDMSKTPNLFKTYIKSKYPRNHAKIISDINASGYRTTGLSDLVPKYKERLVHKLVGEANEGLKFVPKQEIYKKILPKHVIDKMNVEYSWPGGQVPTKYSDALKNLDEMSDKLSKSLTYIVENNLKIIDPSKVKIHGSGAAAYEQISPIKAMMHYLAGGGSKKDRLKAFKKNKWYQSQNFKVGKETKNTFDYLSRIYAKDFVGQNFNDAYDFAKLRRGSISVGGLSAAPLPERIIWQSAARSASQNFKSNIPFEKWAVQILDKKGNPVKDLSIFPIDEKTGLRQIDSTKYQFKYNGKVFNTFKNNPNNLKNIAIKNPEIFEDVYKISNELGEILKTEVTNPKNVNGPKITLRKLFEMTGEKGFAAIGHDDAFGGVQAKPFKDLRIHNKFVNLSLYNAYNHIDNKDLRKRIVNEIYGDLAGKTGAEYTDAWVKKNTQIATDIIKGQGDSLSPYRRGAVSVIEKAGSDILKWGPKKQTEALRIAGIDLSTPEGRLQFRQIGTAKVLNKILEKNKIKICNDKLSEGKGVVCGTKFAERDPNGFMEAIKRNKDAVKIINKPGLVKGALRGVSAWAKKELGPMGWIGSIATIDAAFGLHELGQGKTPLQALDTTLWFLPESVLKADEKMFKDVYERAGYTKEDFGEFQKWRELEDLDRQYFSAKKQTDFMQKQVLMPDDKTVLEKGLQKEVDALPDMYKNMGWNRPLFAITSEEEKTGEHPFYGPAVDRYNKIIDRSEKVYGSLKDPDKSWKDLDYTRKLAAMEEANRKKKLMRESLRYNPDIIPIFGPFSKFGPKEMRDQSFLYDEYVHPLYGPSVSPEQIAAVDEGRFKADLYSDGGRASHMGGGIAGIRRPNAIPPKSGPNPQGLPSMYNRVKRI